MLETLPRASFQGDLFALKTFNIAPLCLQVFALINPLRTPADEVKQQQVAHIQTQHQLANSQISVLQQQLAPHFQFNNLNILSVLIQQAPDEADDFCSLYRYMLEAHKNQLISLEKELEFADDFLHLLAKRFPKVFSLELALTLALHRCSWSSAPYS
jgi:LytS/YehU family sensor histidine kinase